MIIVPLRLRLPSLGLVEYFAWEASYVDRADDLIEICAIDGRLLIGLIEGRSKWRSALEPDMATISPFDDRRINRRVRGGI